MMLSLDLTLTRGAFALAVQAELPAGATMVFGPSGAGKTTLVKAVAGLLRPAAGRIVLDGRVLFDGAAGINLRPQARRIGYVFQEPRLFPHLTVAQNLLYGAGRAAAVTEVVDLLEIGSLLDSKPRSLSGGQAQRVALGRALLTNPDLLILDEPLAALDYRLKAEILPYFERLRDHARLPMLYVTHAVPEVFALGSSLLVLEAGRVAYAGRLQEALRAPDIHRALGPQSAAVLIPATRDRADAPWQTPFGSLPGDEPSGALHGHIRIMACDVIVGTEAASGLTAALHVRARVTGITPLGSSAHLVQLEVQGETLLAEVTTAEAKTLTQGQEVTAFIRRSVFHPFTSS